MARVAETSHPIYVAEMSGDGFRASIVGRDAFVAHLESCPEFALLLGHLPAMPRAYQVVCGKDPMAVVATCSHQRGSPTRALLLKAEFRDTYDEAVALMHQWVAEYRAMADGAGKDVV